MFREANYSEIRDENPLDDDLSVDDRELGSDLPNFGLTSEETATFGWPPDRREDRTSSCRILDTTSRATSRGS